MTAEDAMRRRLAEATAGDYEILHELGRGGMATVYLAHDLSLDRRVAIKVMSPQLVAVEGMAERFLLEARVAAALSHPHIIPIYAVRRAGDLLYFVMKYVAGRSLDAVLSASGRLSVPMVRAILTQVGAALEAAHRRGIVHRDIKPANILLDEHGDAVVADFGIARVGEQPGRTQVGQTVGTPEYMSPEQCGGEPLTGAADQYSLGVVAYELLTGAPPFTGEGLVQVVWRMVNEEIVPLESVRPECAGALATTVHRMLARRSSDRWSTLAEAVSALPSLVLAPDAPVRAELAALAHGAAAGPSALPELPVAALPANSAPTVIATPTQGAAAITLPITSGLMTVDDEVVLAADVYGADGSAIEGVSVTWDSGDPAVARVSEGGRLTALAIGPARLSARHGELVADLSLLVTRAGVRDLSIEPRPATLEVGDRVSLQVASRAAGGAAGGATSRTRLVAWTSSRPDVARVDALGRVTAVAEGTADITARAGGSVATLGLRVTSAVVAAVTVSPPAKRITIGERIRLLAEPANPKGFPLPGFPVRWEVSDAAIAAISPDGELTALQSGQVLVAARVAGRVGLAKVTVAAQPFEQARR